MTASRAVLSPPAGNPDQLSQAAQHLALVAARVQDTTTARDGAHGWGLARSWRGPAFECARDEAATVGAECTTVGAALGPVVAALQRYAAILRDAHRRVASLAQEWDSGARRREQARHDALASLDPVLLASGLGAPSIAATQRMADQEWASLQADLRTRHTAILRSVEAAAGDAAACVWGFVRTLPGGTDDPVRVALLARLPLTEGAVRLAEARALVAALVAGSGRPVGAWSSPQARHIAALGVRAGDPFVAQALMEAMDPASLGRFVERLLAHVYSVVHQRADWSAEAEPALIVLGTALMTAANADAGVALDAGSAARLDRWRTGWLAELANMGSAQVGERVYDPPFTGFTAQAILMDRAIRADPGMGPGTAYAAIVGTALVDADRLAPNIPPPARGPWAVRSPADGIDPVEVLLRAVREDSTAATALLTARLGDGQPVVRYLAGDRLLRAVGQAPTAATSILADVLRKTAVGTDEQSTSIAGAALDGFSAVAEHLASLEAPSLLAADRHLQGLRSVLADLLARHPDAVWAAINDPADPRTWPEDDEVGHPWAVAAEDGWSVRLLNRSRLAALLGELGKDGVVPGTVPTAGAPALALVLTALIGAHSTELAGALNSRDAAQRDAAIVRLGQVTGFVVESARQAVVQVQVGADAAVAERRALVDKITSYIQLPNALKRNLPGIVATLVLGLVRTSVQRIGYGEATMDNAQRTDKAADVERARVEAAVRALGFDLVSVGGWWDAQHDPLDWLRAHPGPAFCGSDGMPLPLAQMTPIQRERFLAWASTVPDYTTLPSALVEAIEDGARAVRTTTAAR